MKLFDAMQQGDVDAVTALAGDPVRFGDMLVSHAELARMGRNAGPLGAALVQNIDVFAMEEVQQQGISWGNTDAIVHRDDVHPTGYIARLVERTASGVAEDVWVFRPVEGGRYVAVVVTSASSPMRRKPAGQ